MNHLLILTLFLQFSPASNMVEDIKVFNSYEQAAKLILKQPKKSASLLTKAINIVEFKNLKYYIDSPYKSFTYHQLLAELRLWRACAYAYSKQDEKAIENLQWIENNNLMQYLFRNNIFFWTLFFIDGPDYYIIKWKYHMV
jgi:hypothetical protein